MCYLRRQGRARPIWDTRSCGHQGSVLYMSHLPGGLCPSSAGVNGCLAGLAEARVWQVPEKLLILRGTGSPPPGAGPSVAVSEGLGARHLTSTAGRCCPQNCAEKTLTLQLCGGAQSRVASSPRLAEMWVALSVPKERWRGSLQDLPMIWLFSV